MVRRSRLLFGAELIVGGGIAGATVVFLRFSNLLPARGETWLVPVVFLYLPLLAAAFTDHDYRAIGMRLPRWKTASVDLGLLLFIILPLFLGSWWLLVRLFLEGEFAWCWPKKLGSLILWQFVGVALPEEVFFRGWLQGRLNQLWGRRWSLLGAPVGPGIFVAAAAFALAHYATKAELERLLVFCPGLLFGFFRERSHSVLVPVLAHGLSNISFLLLQSMRLSS